MANLNVGVGHLAPSFANSGRFYMKLFEKIVGNYNANENGFAHLNSANRQYNLLHKFLGEFVGINL